MSNKNKDQELELPQVDFDSQWKTLMTKHAREFIEYFFTEKFVKTLDLDKGINTNTEDLLKTFPDYGKEGAVLPDKLFRVYEKNGDESFVLIHVEVEKEAKKNITKRMFTYFLRLRERFPNTKITAIAIYIGERLPKKHNVYEYSFGDTKLTYQFNTYVVKQQKEIGLLKSDNPFALAVLTCLYLIQAKKDVGKRYFYKRKLARLCLERNWEKYKIRNLLLFITYTIALPTEFDDIYYKEIVPSMTRKLVPLIEQNPYAARMTFPWYFGKEMDEFLTDLKKEAERLVYEEVEAKIQAEVEAKIQAEVEAKIQAEAEKAKTSIKKMLAKKILSHGDIMDFLNLDESTFKAYLKEIKEQEQAK